MRKYFRRNVAVTNEHGSWVFLISPLLIGLTAGWNLSVPHIYLIIAVFAGFLIRQPISIAVKIRSGRRPDRDLPAVRFWILVYGAIGILMSLGLISQGFGFIALLVLPAIPVFGWHLWLVSRREERRKPGIEIIASGVLALSAPAAYWVSIGSPDPIGWWLWGLTWLQSAASIVYAYLRLEQRVWPEIPPTRTRLQSGLRAMLYVSFNLLVTGILSFTNWLPPWIFVPYTLQWAETFWGVVNPAVGEKPTRIGIRQLIVSTFFTILFIFIWPITY